MKSDIVIRKAEFDDAEMIAEFNRLMAIETEEKEIAKKVIRNGVLNLMKNPQYGFYIVAESGGETAGCLMLTFEWSDWRNGLFLWVQSVYVKPEFRRHGIYRKMYQFVKSYASSREDVCGIRLYVDKNNTSAQKTYKALGMKETSYSFFEELT
ncbi:GNAT family N-acetyltransferase [bacterium]|nr:GNAT family N-acetyltransferase [bacterium]